LAPPGFERIIAAKWIEFEGALKSRTVGHRMCVETAYTRALATSAVSRIGPMTAMVVDGEIAFLTGPNGEVIEFLRSEKL
jgi:hypothetical protein